MKVLRCASCLLLGLWLPLRAAPAQALQLPEPSVHEMDAPDGSKRPRCVVQLPTGFAADQWRPLVLLLPAAPADLSAAKAANAQFGRAVAARGFVVVTAALDDAAALATLAGDLRRQFRIEQGGMHLVAVGAGARSAFALATAQAHEFQSLTCFPGAPTLEPASLPRLRGRAVLLFAAEDDETAAQSLAVLRAARIDAAQRPLPAGDESLAAELAAQLATWHAARTLPGPAGEVARALDDFHDAAAVGEEERYFARLPDDAVFLGTDGTERWTGASFRAFALPYFRRASAWTYVPLSRQVEVADGGAIAWFDEVLDNAAYGECRGTGVLQRREGRWVLRQYNLTIPVPNELARGLVARIRTFAADGAPASTTVVVVRHAEKAGDGDDPDLTVAGRARAETLAKVLRSLPVAAVYTSQYRRTAATVAPLCRERGIAARTLPAADVQAVAERIRSTHAGETVVVAGHSNTVPPLLAVLGVTGEVKIADDEYDRLFVVRLGPDGAELLSLHYGDR